MGTRYQTPGKGGVISEAERERYNNMIRAAMTPYIESLNTDEPMLSLGQLISIKPDNEGYRVLRNLKHELEPRLAQLKKDGESTMLQFLGKSTQHVLKLAAVIYIGDELGVHRNIRSKTMTVDYIHKAIKLFMALAVHTKQILSSSGSDGELAETRAVLDFMQEKNRGGMQVNIAAQFVSRRVPFRAARKPYQAVFVRF